MCISRGFCPFVTVIFFLLVNPFTSAAQSAVSFVKYDSKFIQYEGRVGFKQEVAELYWSGTTLTMHFEGTGISAVLQDRDTANYYNVILDNVVIAKIHPDTTKKVYALATNLPRGKHKLELFKRTEWDKGKTWFYGFQLAEGGRPLPAPAPKKRKIEFYGNSITCGYATEDTSKNDSWFGYFENNYVSYAALTARHYDAQYSCIAKSGIGILLSWFPLIMPQLYDRLDPTNSTSKWNFATYTPDVVVINLMQNDSWLVNMKNHEQFKAKFGTTAPTASQIIAAYKRFVRTIRSRYPKSHIICALGNMDATRKGSPWPGYVQAAVAQLQDKNIYTHFFAYKNTPGHPKVQEQKAMADSLIQFMDKTIKW